MKLPLDLEMAGRCAGLKLAYFVTGIWLNLVFGKAEKFEYVSRTGTDR